MIQGREKRYDEREDFHNPITFQISAHRAAPFEEVTKRGLCVDISSSGIGLVANCHLQEGEIMEIHVPIGVKDVTVRVFAEVRWSAFVGDSARTGLRFL